MVVIFEIIRDKFVVMGVVDPEYAVYLQGVEFDNYDNLTELQQIAVKQYLKTKLRVYCK